MSQENACETLRHAVAQFRASVCTCAPVKGGMYEGVPQWACDACRLPENEALTDALIAHSKEERRLGCRYEADGIEIRRDGRPWACAPHDAVDIAAELEMLRREAEEWKARAIGFKERFRFAQEDFERERRARLNHAPAYNHNREDSALTPCDTCKAAQS